MNSPRIVLALLCAAACWAIPAARAVDTDKELDRLTLDDFAQSLKKTRTRLDELHEQAAKQFDQLIANALREGLGDSQQYLKPLEDRTKLILGEFDAKLSNSQSEALNRAVIRARDRGDKGFENEVTKAINARGELRAEVDGLRRAYAVPPGGKEAQLNLAIFEPLARELADRIAREGQLLKSIHLDRDTVEDFLTDNTRGMWEKVKKGKSGSNLFSSLERKKIDEIMQMIAQKRTFDCEKVLREAMQRYPESPDVHLLYAYILLINESNPRATDEGFTFLVEAYNKLQTERLAYNVVRVGARLKRMDREMLMKLTDHVKYRDDSEGLGNLYNLALYRFIQMEDFEGAITLYEKLVQSDRAKRLAPPLAMIVLLRVGKYERIAKEVQAKSVSELLTIGTASAGNEPPAVKIAGQ